jgi:hypothetical protein
MKTSRSMPGTLKRYRSSGTCGNDARCDQLLLIYLEGRFSSDAEARFDDDEDKSAATGGDDHSRVSCYVGSMEGEDNKMDEAAFAALQRQCTLGINAAGNRTNASVGFTDQSPEAATLESRRQAKNCAVAAPERTVSRGGNAVDRRSPPVTSSSNSAMTRSATRTLFRCPINQLRRRTRSEDNLSIYGTRLSKVTADVRAPVKEASSLSAFQLFECRGGDENGCIVVVSNGDGASRVDSGRFRRCVRVCRPRKFHRRSWQGQRTFDATDDDDRKLPSSSGKTDVSRRHIPSQAANVPAENNNNNATGSDAATSLKKVDSFDSGIDTKADTVALRNVLIQMTDDQTCDACGSGPMTKADEASATRRSAETADKVRESPACSRRRRRAPLTDAEVEFNLLASRTVSALRHLAMSDAPACVTGTRTVADGAEAIRSDGETNGEHRTVDAAETDESATLSEESPQVARWSRNDIDELCRVLQPPPATTAMYYINGVFDDVERTVSSTLDDSVVNDSTELSAVERGDVDGETSLAELKVWLDSYLRAPLCFRNDQVFALMSCGPQRNQNDDVSGASDSRSNADSFCVSANNLLSVSVGRMIDCKTSDVLRRLPLLFEC